MTFESLKQIGLDVNQRMDTPINSQIHAFPGKQPDKPKRGRPPKKKDDAVAFPKRKPGRPKGSKNKKTLMKESSGETEPAPKRGPGRPKGSKNKPKSDQPPVKRGRGRPRKTTD